MTIQTSITYFVRRPLAVYRLNLGGALLVTLVVLLPLKSRLENGFQMGHVAETLIVVMLIVVQLSIRRTPSLYNNSGMAVDHEISSSIIARMSMGWCKESLQMAGIMTE